MLSTTKGCERFTRLARLRWVPRRCRLCAAPAGQELALCSDCLADLGPAPGPLCAGCGRPQAGMPCPACGAAGWPPVHAAACYRFPVDRLVLRLKYARETALGELLGRLLWRRLRCRLGVGRVAAVPVPLHRRRLRERGFNQAALIARSLAGAGGLAVDCGAVRRVRDTPRQGRQGRGARARNLARAFEVRAPPACPVVVVDDVFTTGATTRALVTALRDAGAEVAAIWCVAWAPPPPGPVPVRRPR